MSSRARKVVPALGLWMLAAAIAWFGTRQIAPLRIAETWLDDLRLAHISTPRPQNTDVVLLTVTEETLGRFPYRSPISRSFLAGLLNDLAAMNIRAVGIDLIFDQPTISTQDQQLSRAFREFPRPLIVAVGDETNGLTPRQLAFQAEYLGTELVGSAGLLLTDGSVRNIYPGEVDGDDSRPSFVAALAAALGAAVPATPERLNYRARTESGSPVVRSFPAHRLSLLPAEWFDGTVVLIGADLPNQDRYRTPLSVLGGDYSTMAGAEIHAQALVQLLEGDDFPALNVWLQATVLVTALLIGFVLPLIGIHVLLKLLLGAGALIFYWTFAVLYYANGGMMLPLLAPTFGFVIAASFSSAYGRWKERGEKRFLRDAFQRYVSPNVIDHILENPEKLKLGGEKRYMSFVFADLAGFTTLSEELAPEDVVSLLQEYFQGMLRIALELGGTIDRLVGDGVNVLFGAPADQPDHMERAVRCALHWDRFCQSFRHDKLASGIELGITRIGVHAGPAAVGNVGSTERFQYTAHGDAVNTAARLETANKLVGTRVCISCTAAQGFPDEIFRPVGHIVPRGKSNGIDCVTVCDEMPPEALEKYLRAFDEMEKNVSQAQRLFEALATELPADPLVRLHLQRLRAGQAGSTIWMEAHQ